MNVPLSREFDYLPASDGPSAVPGARVEVPFGRRRQIAMVMATTSDSAVSRDRIRRCISTVDEQALLAGEDLWLIRFTSDYYHHPIGEVVAAALPALLRQGRSLYPVEHRVMVTDSGAATDIETLSRRAPRQAELLEALLDAGGDGLTVDVLLEQMPAWRRAARPLLQRGLIRTFEARSFDKGLPEPVAARPGPELNADQLKAVEQILSGREFAASVLDGVTGSGKTEVYLRVMREHLSAGEQVLVLVPEIGLTPQLVARLQERLGIAPVTLHSGLTDTERLAAWREARSGDARLVVGTRSAVFTPMPRLGLIVVDEEHDPSFKQQEGLRYSARDLAIARAKHRNIPVVLGSATPTLELLQHCRQGNYRHLRLPRRAGSAMPPLVQLVDINRAAPVDGISEPLADAMASHLAANGQVLLFLNRRGFAPTLICAACGHIAECRRCDSRMTVHASDSELRCHHCGARRRLDRTCTDCGGDMRPLGEGTQRLEAALRKRFPDYQAQRIDSDSTQGRDAIHQALASAEQGETRILVGTQMLSKGHHFPQLSLVGIVNADQGLFGADFRSAERLAQSITQVAGRAGRENKQGMVVIQTAFPDNPFWHMLMHGGYDALASEALTEREKTRWPPFTRLALIRSAAHEHRLAHAFLDTAKKHVASYGAGQLRMLGPVDAPMARRAGRFRAQLLLQSPDRRELHSVLARLRPVLEDDPIARRLRWSIDVDPIELF